MPGHYNTRSGAWDGQLANPDVLPDAPHHRVQPPLLDRQPRLSDTRRPSLAHFRDSWARRRFLVFDCEELTADQLLVLLVLEQGANVDTGWVLGPRGWDITQRTLGYMARRSPSTVQRAVRALEVAGYLEIIDNSPEGRGNNYRLLFPPHHGPPPNPEDWSRQELQESRWSRPPPVTVTTPPRSQ